MGVGCAFRPRGGDLWQGLQRALCLYTMPDRALMRGVYGVLTKKQKRSAQLLWEGYRVWQIASLLQVNRSTVWRWYQRQDLRQYAESLFRQNDEELAEQLAEEKFRIINGSDKKKANEMANRLLDRYLPYVF